MLYEQFSERTVLQERKAGGVCLKQNLARRKITRQTPLGGRVTSLQHMILYDTIHGYTDPFALIRLFGIPGKTQRN